jgi:hypothetical protein
VNESGEIIKSGAFGKLADLIYKLAGPVSEEVGLLMADKMKAYRVQNWVKVVHKTKRILAEARLPPKAVPPRLFLPIFEAFFHRGRREPSRPVGWTVSQRVGTM